jgi:hypothetical protein
VLCLSCFLARRGGHLMCSGSGNDNGNVNGNVDVVVVTVEV